MHQNNNQTMKSIHSKFKSQLQDSQPSPFPMQPIEQTTITRNYKQLTSIPIPSSTTIIHLHLAHNQITSLFNIHLYTNLQSLNISHNHLQHTHQFKDIVNKQKLKRLSIRNNKFLDYGYQDNLVGMFKNLVELDHIKLDNREMVEKHKEYIKENYVKSFYIIQRLKVMMESFASQTKVNQIINKTTQQITNRTHHNNKIDKNFHKKGLLKLLYQNVNQKSIYELTNIISKSHNLQNLQHSTLLKMMSKMIKVILISDVKCTCRPFNLRKALLSNYGQILQSMIKTFAGLFNNQLQKYLERKIQTKTNPFRQTDEQYRKMEALIQFSKLQPQNVKIMDTIEYKKYFQKQNNPLQYVETIKVDRSVSDTVKLTTKPEQYYENKKKQKLQKQQRDNSPDEFLFRFPVFAYSQDYLLVMATIMKKKVQQILELHNTIVVYETNKTRGGQINKTSTNKVTQKHSRSRSASNDNHQKSISTNARTTMYNNQNINYINQMSFEKTLPESTKQDQTKSNTTKVHQHKKSSSQSIPQLPLFDHPVTAQKLYQYSLMYKTFSGLILNVKQSALTSKI